MGIQKFETLARKYRWMMRGLGFAILTLSAFGCREKGDDCGEYCHRSESMNCREKRTYGPISYYIGFRWGIDYDYFCTDDVGREVPSGQLRVKSYSASCSFTSEDPTDYYAFDGETSESLIPKVCAGTIDDSPYSYSGAYSDETNAFTMIIKETGIEAPIDTFDMPCGELEVTNNYER